MSNTMSLSNCEWKEANLYEIIDLIGGGTPKTSVPEYWNGDIPWLSVADFNNGKKYVFETEKTITESGLRNSSTKLLNKGDIIISARGTVGVVAVLGKEMTFNQSCYGIRAISDLATADYVYYLLKDTVLGFLQIAHGGVFDTITRDTFKEIDISLPPLPEQIAIATILSSLDDKIDLLNRQNTTLEKMAETLFRKWFVEEAKEEWEEVKIKDFDVIVTDFVANGSFASLKDNVTLINEGPGYALFIRNTDLKSDFTKKVFVDEHAYNFLSKTKLFGGEVIISNVGDVGSVFRCPKFNIPMTLGNNVVMLKSKYNNFFYLFFNSDYGQSLIYGITSGSVQEKFNKTAFRDIAINYPSLEYITEFENLIAPYFDKIDKNKEQIRTLTTLRDTLLPKLMSGEERVEY
jgi:type I restriction enzyme S subunit